MLTATGKLPCSRKDSTAAKKNKFYSGKDVHYDASNINLLPNEITRANKETQWSGVSQDLAVVTLSDQRIHSPWCQCGITCSKRAIIQGLRLSARYEECCDDERRCHELKIECWMLFLFSKGVHPKIKSKSIACMHACPVPWASRGLWVPPSLHVEPLYEKVS